MKFCYRRISPKSGFSAFDSKYKFQFVEEKNFNFVHLRQNTKFSMKSINSNHKKGTHCEKAK